jgi:hypothetical protein
MAHHRRRKLTFKRRSLMGMFANFVQSCLLKSGELRHLVHESHRQFAPAGSSRWDEHGDGITNL